MQRYLRAAKRRFMKVYGLLKPFPFIEKKSMRGRYNISHVSAFDYSNAGDIILPIVLRDLFNRQISTKKWRGIRVRRKVDAKLIDKINSSNALVIGGGGLFLKDTNANNISGWQWACSTNLLKDIDVPIIMFAVGYNRFRGQDDFEPCFYENINVFAEKASFIGLRNHGSIRKIKEYLYSDELKEKLIFQPCMTTLISKLYPNFTNYKDKEDFIALNCAFDRSNLRKFNEDKLREIARVALALSKITKIKYYYHMSSDCNILEYFDELDFDYEVVEIKNARQMINEYAKPRVVIGMRGHAQMVPFGCLTPILSIVSHDKMQWFLDDINHPEWGVEISDNNFYEQLLSRAIDAYNSYQSRYEEIIVQQESLWKISLENVKKINEIIEKNKI